MSDQEFYCPLIKHHLYINNAGYLNPCCAAYPQYFDQENNEGMDQRHVVRHGVKGALQSQYMQNLLRQNEDGQWPKKCYVCKDNEDRGVRSVRKRYIENWPENEIGLRTMDLRLGNVCNLKCRMCSPFSSVKLQSEWLNSPEPKMNMESQYYEKMNWKNWSEETSVWDELFELSSNVRRINFAGGEPLVNKAHVLFLKKLIEAGRASDIVLNYNTNLAILPDWFAEIVPKFKHITLAVSIDGYGDLNHFIRYPAKWDDLEQNLHRVEALATAHPGHLNADIQTTIQVYNILYLDQLLEFLFAQNWKYIRPLPISNFVHNPKYFSASILGKEAKDLAVGRLVSFIERFDSQGGSEENLKKLNGFRQQVENFLQKEGSQKLIEEFQVANTHYDTGRNQDFFKIAPEMKAFLL